MEVLWNVVFTPCSHLKNKGKAKNKKVIYLYYALKYRYIFLKKDILANASIIKTLSSKNLQNTL